jgi:hypothetical protein
VLYIGRAKKVLLWYCLCSRVWRSIFASGCIGRLSSAAKPHFRWAWERVQYDYGCGSCEDDYWGREQQQHHVCHSSSAIEGFGLHQTYKPGAEPICLLHCTDSWSGHCHNCHVNCQLSVPLWTPNTANGTLTLRVLMAVRHLSLIRQRRGTTRAQGHDASAFAVAQTTVVQICQSSTAADMLCLLRLTGA